MRDKFNYLLIFSCDVFWMAFAGAATQAPSVLGVTSQEAIMTSISPLLSIKLFNYLNRMVHSGINNGTYMTYFLLFLTPLLLLEIFLVEDLMAISYILDGVIIVYSLFFLLFWANKDEFLFIIREAKSILGSKKGRLKIF